MHGHIGKVGLLVASIICVIVMYHHQVVSGIFDLYSTHTKFPLLFLPALFLRFFVNEGQSFLPLVSNLISCLVGRIVLFCCIPLFLKPILEHFPFHFHLSFFDQHDIAWFKLVSFINHVKIIIWTIKRIVLIGIFLLLIP